ncbi:hypothetical protein SIN8267_02054 [Sinobacterium norvegicum]|uniref:Uncharacterized protein n=1 Tax=Sinobacterium norvegicum TaxID=1641715 RepID=A0ABN8EIQ9_9GAMM|nr:hypothetical protein [Sinobacterium norvegicum]CAH0991939.1 hypothetical protein SIN8267_02054 [Sinobacterium norvegicum]
MKNKMNVLRAAVVAGSVLVAGSAIAADGSIGTSSEGDVLLTAVIPTLFKVNIENDDLNFGTLADTTVGSRTMETGFCVQSTGGADFKLSLSAVTGAATDITAFTLLGQGLTPDSIGFSAEYLATSGAAAGSGSDLAPGQTINLSTAENFLGCANNNESGYISYVINETSLLAAKADTYVATSYVTVTAQ